MNDVQAEGCAAAISHATGRKRTRQGPQLWRIASRRRMTSVPRAAARAASTEKTCAGRAETARDCRGAAAARNGRRGDFRLSALPWLFHTPGPAGTAETCPRRVRPACREPRRRRSSRRRNCSGTVFPAPAVGAPAHLNPVAAGGVGSRLRLRRNRRRHNRPDVQTPSRRTPAHRLPHNTALPYNAAFPHNRGPSGTDRWRTTLDKQRSPGSARRQSSGST